MNGKPRGKMDLSPLFANADKVVAAASSGKLDPVAFLAHTESFLCAPDIGLEGETTTSERNGRMFQTQILNMKVVRSVRVAGSNLRKLIENGMDNAVPLDVRCLRALLRHQEVVPKDWLNENEPILFIGTVAVRKDGGGKCVYGLKLEKPASRSQFVVRNVDDITEKTAYLIAYIAEEFFSGEIEEKPQKEPPAIHTMCRPGGS